jgi:hypothetical protein
LPSVPALAAGSDSSIPSVIQAGFGFFTKGQVGPAIAAWQKGGLLAQYQSSSFFNYFTELQRAVGTYKSYELIQTKRLGSSSKIIYLSINYERAAIYARFLVYRTEQDWVVQNMNFNIRPEALMSWLAMEEGQ